MKESEHKLPSSKFDISGMEITVDRSNLYIEEDDTTMTNEDDFDFSHNDSDDYDGVDGEKMDGDKNTRKR